MSEGEKQFINGFALRGLHGLLDHYFSLKSASLLLGGGGAFIGNIKGRLEDIAITVPRIEENVFDRFPVSDSEVKAQFLSVEYPPSQYKRDIQATKEDFERLGFKVFFVDKRVTSGSKTLTPDLENAEQATEQGAGTFYLQVDPKDLRSTLINLGKAIVNLQTTIQEHNKNAFVGYHMEGLVGGPHQLASLVAEIFDSSGVVRGKKQT